MKSFFLFLLCISLACFSGCSRKILVVQTEFLSHENLASYHVRTPDPRLWNPQVGQRLLVSWNLFGKLGKLPDLKLILNLRFYNHTEAREVIPICQSSGLYIYSLLNEEYCQKKGILTYQAQIYSGDCLIDEWRHQLWVELISISPENSNVTKP